MEYKLVYGTKAKSRREWLALRYCGDRRGCYKKKCIICNQIFFAIRPEAKYCSSTCQIVSYIQRRAEVRKLARQKRCLVCKKLFEAKRKDAKFCSSSCKQSSYRNKFRLIEQTKKSNKE